MADEAVAASPNQVRNRLTSGMAATKPAEVTESPSRMQLAASWPLAGRHGRYGRYGRYGLSQHDQKKIAKHWKMEGMPRNRFG